MKLLLFVLGMGFTVIAWADPYWSIEPLSARTSAVAAHFRLDIVALNQTLRQLNDKRKVIISLPRADGKLNKFYIQQTFVIAPDLALKYPGLKTYKFQHTSKYNIHGRMELMGNTLSAMIKTPNGQETIDLQSDFSSNYQVKQRVSMQNKAFSCGTVNSANQTSLGMRIAENKQYRAPINNLKKLRVAIATTEEYSAKFGSTKASVLAEIMKAVNRINAVFESELAVTLELVSNNVDIIFLSADSFSNNDASLLIDQSQSIIDKVIGSSNYDLGHVFSTGGGGLASVASVCRSNVKAQGVTGNSNPTTDSFWVDYVAHEMGHQLGGEHTFNGSSGSCSGNSRVDAYAYEPGSGSTIMAYAGICNGENLQLHSNANFHSTSILKISNSIPANCGTDVLYNAISGKSNFNNPTIDAGKNYNIPVNTPFVLSANGADLDNDIVFYQWDGIDKGISTSSDNIGCDLKDNALFQSNLAKSENSRYFPSIETLLSGQSYAGETIPTTDRDINFTVKVTDNKGGYATDDIILTSYTSSNAFRVTSQNTIESYSVNDVVTVNWDVANTAVAPISCPAVDIQLLSFNANKSKFSIQVLSKGELNNGTVRVSIPSDGNSLASRFIIKCSNNVFFAMNSADFSISGGSVDAINNTNSSSGGINLKNNTLATSLSLCPFIVKPTTTRTSGLSSNGGGIISLWLIVFLSGLLLARRRL